MSDVDWEQVASEAKAQTQRADELILLADQTVARADETRAQLVELVEEYEAHQ